MEIRHNNFDEVKIVEHIGNYGDIVHKSVRKANLDFDGTIQYYTTDVYNIMLVNGSLVVDEWFDIYDKDCHGNCIIGYSRTMLECSELWDSVPSYRSCSKQYGGTLLSGTLLEQYKYRYGAINSNGVLAVYPVYDRLTFNNEDSYTAWHDGYLGYIDSIDGHNITPIVFQHAQPFFEHKAAVEYYGKMGYVSRNKIMENPNNKDEYAIAPKFDTAGDFENGYAKVSENGEVYVIDENGNKYSKDNNVFPDDKQKKKLQLNP